MDWYCIPPLSNSHAIRPIYSGYVSLLLRGCVFQRQLFSELWLSRLRDRRHFSEPRCQTFLQDLFATNSFALEKDLAYGVFQAPVWRRKFLRSELSFTELAGPSQVRSYSTAIGCLQSIFIRYSTLILSNKFPIPLLVFSMFESSHLLFFAQYASAISAFPTYFRQLVEKMEE